MNIQELKSNKGNYVDGLKLINPNIIKDKRGFFYESWNEFLFNKKVCQTKFLQDNHSRSKKGVLRGIHYQVMPYSQGKLVRCTLGKVYDVAVDLRKESPTFKEWVSVELTESNKSIFWIPEGFGHGFLTLTNFAEVQYKVTNTWNSNSEKTILWNDTTLGIKWPVDEFAILEPMISSKDFSGLTFEQALQEGYLF